MQITQDKCHGAPKGNCNDVDFKQVDLVPRYVANSNQLFIPIRTHSIRTGAKYFAQVLKESDYNLLVAIGQ